MTSDGFIKFLRTQIRIAEDQLVVAKAKDIAAAADGSGWRQRFAVHRKRERLSVLKLVLRAYQDFKGVRG